jgi:asparagine synthase (glutamine-hydrolysing)
VPFLDHRLVHKAINLPTDYRVGARANKWVLRRIASRYISADLAGRRKMGFPLPLADYVRPFASIDFFAGGFCEEELGLDRRGLARLLGDWERSVYFLFGLLTLEIWGRIHFRQQSVALIDEQMRRRERPGASRAA